MPLRFMDSNLESSGRIFVCHSRELPSGTRKVVRIQGKEIGVFHLNGKYRALSNHCPHKGAPLCLGRLRPLVHWEPQGGLQYSRENEILQCPWHQWEFDTEDGRAISNPRLRVKTYAVERTGDRIFIRL